MIRDAKWQMDLKGEMLKRTCIQDLDADAHPALSQDKTVTSAHRGRRTFVEFRARPLRELEWVREQLPHALRRYVDDFGGTHFHCQVRFLFHAQGQ